MADNNTRVIPGLDAWTKVQNAVIKINNITGAASQSATGLVIGSDVQRSRNCLTPDWVVVKITGGDPNYGYDWIEQIASDTFGNWQDMQGGRTSDMGKAFEFNDGSADVGDIVEIIPTMQGTWAFAMSKIRWGVITAIYGDCADLLTVNPSTRAGVELVGVAPVTLYTTNPLLETGIGLRYGVSDIVAYHAIGPGEGLLINPYKSFDVRLECDSAAPLSADVESLRFNEFDFDLRTSQIEECPVESIVSVRWAGFRVCDSYSAATVEHVKKLCFDGEPSGLTGITSKVVFTVASVDDTATIEGCSELTLNPIEFKKINVSGSVVVPPAYISIYDCDDNLQDNITSLKFGMGLSVSGTTITVQTPTAGDNIEITPGSTCEPYEIGWTGLTVGECTGVKTILVGDGLEVECDGDTATLTANGDCGDGGGATLIGTGDEDGEAEDGTSWDRSSGVGVQVWTQTRTVYDEGGDKKLYGYKQLWTFDKCGKLKSISGETRYEIDEPDDCGGEA